VLERLVDRIEIRQEIEPIVNMPLSIVISGGLTLVGYVSPSRSTVRKKPGASSLGHNALAVAISLFLIGFFMMINRRKALTQVLALLSLENGLFLAAISLTYGMPLIVELGVFFDVLVAVMVLGILVYRIRESPSSRWMSAAAEAARLGCCCSLSCWRSLFAGASRVGVLRAPARRHGSGQRGRLRPHVSAGSRWRASAARGRSPVERLPSTPMR
jgi:hypothetical protein